MTETLELLIIVGISIGIAWLLVKWLDTGIFEREPPLHKAAANGATIPIRRLLQRKFVDINEKAGKFKDTALHEASMAGRVRVIQILIDNGVNINIRNKIGYTPLHAAVIEDNVEAAKCLIKNKANVYARNDLGMTPIELAKILENDKVHNYLNSISSNNDEKFKGNLDFDDSSPGMHWAVSRGTVSALKIALNNMASKINEQDHAGRTSLHIAVLSGSKKKVALLLKAGANPHIYCQDGLLPIHHAIRKEYKQITRLLKKYGYPE